MEEKSSFKHNTEKDHFAKIDYAIWIPGVIITIFLSVVFLKNPSGSLTVLNKILSFMTHQLGWTYIWFTIGALMFCGYLIFGKMGKIILGVKGEKPDFSTGSWIGMIFTASTGSSLLYWGTIEWAYYWQSPPLGAEIGSWQAAELASSYGMFHWGINGWAVYSVISVAVAYAYHVKKRPVLRLSDACAGVIGEKRSKSGLGKFIDVFFIFGVIGGVVTSMGLGVPMIGAAFSNIFGIEHTMRLDIIIIIFWTAAIAITVALGLDKGIKNLSNFNIYFAFGLLVVILIFGGHFVFIVNQTTSAVGVMAQNFIKMSTWTDAVGNSGFPQDWSIFYWAWWVVYAPALGLYIAKISRGRSIRQVVLGSLLWGSLGSWVFFSILGNYSMALQFAHDGREAFKGGVSENILGIMSDKGAADAVIATIAAIPYISKITVLGFLILAFIAMITGQITIAFTLASVTSKELKQSQEPSRWNSVTWSILLGLISASLLLMNALKPLQTLSVVTAFPLMAILIIIAISGFKMIKKDHPTNKDE